MSDVRSWTLKQTTGDTVTKMVLIAVGSFANWETGKCFPSIDRIAQVCEAHPNTVRRHLHALEEKGIISLQKRNGTSYLITLVGYEEWLKTLPDKGSTRQVGVHQREGYSKSASPLPQECIPPTCEVGKLNNLTNNLTNSFKREEEDSSTTSAVVEERVSLSNEKIKLCDELNNFWLSQFDGQQTDLDLALVQIAAYIQPNSRTASLEKQVSSQLAKIARERRERDKRYQTAAKNNSARNKSSYEPPKKTSYDPNANEFWAKVDRGEIKI